MADLLESAADLNCHWRGSIAVPAGPDFRSPRVRLFWDEYDSRRFSSGNLFEIGDPAIVLYYEAPFNEQQGDYRPARAAWRAGDSPVDAMDALIVAMQRAGHVKAANSVTPKALSKHHL